MNGSMAVLAVIVLAVFLGILIWHVPRLDLIVVCGLTFALAAYDTWRAAFTKGG